MTLEILELIFERTCSVCPEQYDVFYKGKQIGYVRLRHGRLSADYIDENVIDEIGQYERTQVFCHDFDNDPYYGFFEDEYERIHYLYAIAKELKKHLPAHGD